MPGPGQLTVVNWAVGAQQAFRHARANCYEPPRPRKSESGQPGGNVEVPNNVQQPEPQEPRNSLDMSVVH